MRSRMAHGSPDAARCLADLRADAATFAGVYLRLMFGDGARALGLKLFAGAEAAVSFARGKQTLGVLAVDDPVAPIAGRVRVGRPRPGPSVQSRPSQRRSSISCAS